MWINYRAVGTNEFITNFICLWFTITNDSQTELLDTTEIVTTEVTTEILTYSALAPLISYSLDMGPAECREARILPFSTRNGLFFATCKYTDIRIWSYNLSQNSIKYFPSKAFLFKFLQKIATLW
jgi:hypothetical protein